MERGPFPCSAALSIRARPPLDSSLDKILEHTLKRVKSTIVLEKPRMTISECPHVFHASCRVALFTANGTTFPTGRCNLAEVNILSESEPRRTPRFADNRSHRWRYAEMNNITLDPSSYRVTKAGGEAFLLEMGSVAPVRPEEFSSRYESSERNYFSLFTVARKAEKI